MTLSEFNGFWATGRAMPQTVHTIIPDLIERHYQRLLDGWLAGQKRMDYAGGQIAENRLDDQSRRFLAEMRKGVAAGHLDTVASERAVSGFSPSETAVFVFSLKEPLFELLREEITDVGVLARETWAASLLIDKLGMHTVEVYQKGRDDVIGRQQEELLELSTPVIQLWESILLIPLIGTLDSARSQTVMESLLERIVTSRAQVAIIDITGVPTVDTLVAQHLIRTVSAARLMGADCIISGIRPQIAQTIVHLGRSMSSRRPRWPMHSRWLYARSAKGYATTNRKPATITRALTTCEPRCVLRREVSGPQYRSGMSHTTGAPPHAGVAGFAQQTWPPTRNPGKAIRGRGAR